MEEGQRGGGGGDARNGMERALVPVNGVDTNGGVGEESTGRRMGLNGVTRPMLSGTLRCRLLRRAWRPVLVTIPEQ